MLLRYLIYNNSFNLAVMLLMVLNVSGQTIPEIQKNYTVQIIYDDNEVPISFVQTYKDKLGRSEQIQSKDYENDNVIATQHVYDEFGRLSIRSLPAPLYKLNTDEYITDLFGAAVSGSKPYSVDEFDIPNSSNGNLGELNNPIGVKNSGKGSIGWYYSNSNDEESYVPITSFPYTRRSYDLDAGTDVVQSSLAGDQLNMGSQNIKKFFFASKTPELKYIFGVETPAYKSISADEEGLERVTYTRSDGKVIAKCFSGVREDTVCRTQFVSYYLKHGINQYADIHIPNSSNSYLKIKENQAQTSCNGWVIYLELTDLTTGYKLIRNQDFSESFVTQNGNSFIEVNFINDYANKGRYLRLKLSHGSTYVNCINSTAGVSMPYQEVIVRTDYSDWSLYNYDDQGNLVETIPPEGVDCDSYIPTATTVNDVNADGVEHVTKNTTGTTLNTDPVLLDYLSGLNVTNQQAKAFIDFELVLGRTSYRDGFTPPPCDYQPGMDYGSGMIKVGDQTEFDFDEESTEEESDNFNRGYSIQEALNSLSPNYRNSGEIFIEEGEIDYDNAINNYNELNEYQKPLGMDYNAYIPNTDDDGSSSGDLSSDIWISIRDILTEVEYCAITGLSCYDKIQNCGETDIDQGGACTYIPICYGRPYEKIGTFKVTIDAKGRNRSTGLWQIFDVFNGGIESNGTWSSDPNYIPHSSQVYYVSLVRNCICVYQFQLEQGPLNLYSYVQEGPSELYDQIKFEISDIQYAPFHVNNVDVFSPIDLSDPIQDMGRRIGFKAKANYKFAPKVTEPVHTEQESRTYNFYEQLSSVSSTDEGTTTYHYDDLNRLKYWQTAVQLINDKYSYIDYDKSGRIVERGQLQSTTLPATNLKVGSSSFVTEEVHQVEYDLPGSYFPPSLSGYNQEYLKGKVSKTSNANSSTWYGYDEIGRLKWSVQYLNALNRPFTINYSYNVQGNVETLEFQKEVSGERLVHHYDYDDNGRLTNVKTSIDGVYANATQNAAYYYYQHGPLKRVELGNDLQGIDYVYTINNRLKSINNPVLGSRDPGEDGNSGSLHVSFAKDIFGMTLDYYAEDYVRSNTAIQTYNEHYYTFPNNDLVVEPSQYNGNIQGIRWRTRSEVSSSSTEFEGKQLIYMPKYDSRNRLQSAFFGTILSADKGIQNTSTPPQAGVFDGPSPAIRQDYKVWNIEYDLNGNLTTLNRNGYSNGSSSLAMDKLNFNRSGNRLNQVTDAVLYTPLYGDDIESQTAGNYSYDASGRMTADAKSNNFLTYNSDNLPLEVYSNASTTNIKQSLAYDERGQRLSKVFNSGNTEQYYIRDVNGSLMAIIHDNGSTTETELPVYGSAQLGFYNHNDSEYRYQITDHLGNVRATIGGTKVGSPADVELLGMQDYYPFGSKMPGRSISMSTFYKLGYQGQPEDDETGLNAFELRLYDARIGGWLSPDPYKQHFSPYMAMSNNPLSFIDPDGGMDLNECADPPCNGANETNDWKAEKAFNADILIKGILENGADWYEENFGTFWSDVMEGIQKGMYYVTGEEEKYKDGNQFTVLYVDEDPTYIESNISSFQIDEIVRGEGEALNSPVGDAPISSAFMANRNCSDCSSTHGGTDYAVPNGTKVVATASGKVERAYRSSSYGNVVIINHGERRNGSIYTLYGHGSSLEVKPNTRVNLGDLVLSSGNTGNSTGPHLHYEVIQTNLSPFSNEFFNNNLIRYAPSDLNNLLNP